MLSLLDLGQQLLPRRLLDVQEVEKHLAAVLELLPVLLGALGLRGLVVNAHHDGHDADEQQPERLHPLDGLALLHLLPLAPDLVLESLGLLLVLLDEGLDLVLVEVLQFHEAVLLLLGF
jgi:hypothetical protein